MTLLKIIRTATQLDYLTIISCIHFCATLNNKNRSDFQKEYGMKIDRNITNIIQQLKEN